jgi:hypothetical protein
MNYKKQRLAKEILYFFFASVCTLLLWCCIETKNYFTNNKISKLTKETSSFTFQIDSLDKVVVLDENRRKQVDSNIISMLDRGATEDDVRRYVYDFKKKFGKKEVFEKQEQLIRNKNLTLQNLVDTQNKLFDNNEKKNILIWGLIIFFGILYPLRFVYFALMWSFKTLKETK